MRLIMVGHPNVGKSALFNRLTGARVVVSNYPGTTVEFTRGVMRLVGRRVEVLDFPGTYSLDSSCKAEEVVLAGLEEMAPDDVLLNVVDSTNLERNLGLTLQLLSLRRPMLVALNFWDEAQHTGVSIDAPALEQRLGVPCVPVVAVAGLGIRTLVERIRESRPSTYLLNGRCRWEAVGEIVREVQTLRHRHHTWRERLGDASLQPFTGAAIAVVVLGGSMAVVHWVGEGLIEGVCEPLFVRMWTPAVLWLSTHWGNEGWLHDVLIGTLTGGEINYGESFGLLTTGLYVPLAVILPYVFAFYSVLAVLEDSGYLPRLAVLADRLMHTVGLHGMGVIPMLLGMGCNVPGALSCRIMESERERFIASALLAIGVPCMAQTAMIVGLAGRYPLALPIIFGSLVIIWFALGLLMNRFLPGESPEILVDVPPYRRPRVRSLAKKVGMHLTWYLREAVPFVLLGVLLANLLYHLGVIAFAGRLAAPVVGGVLGLPAESVGGLLIGLLRKDLAVGMLAPLDLPFRQTVVACVVLVLYFPCVATLPVLLKELGSRQMLLAAAIMIGTALAAGGILNLALWATVG
ncbi:ferrous iron transporter B [bacterium]|nr:ferrous iron transporter B [bacterium]